MTTAWFNCGSGVAGDMILGALVDAGADRMEIADILGGLAVEDYALTFERTMRCGVSSTRALVAVHDDSDHHVHRPWRDIRMLIESSSLPDSVSRRSIDVFTRLADVEARIHGVHIDDVEFHEVGSTDAIVDIVGVCAALESLGVDHVVCSPIAVGHGLVTTAHGQLPNPAPAVARLLADSGAPIIGLDDDCELSTPTGVALMVAYADSFGAPPDMTVSSIGYGAGARDRPGRANVVSVAIGQRSSGTVAPGRGQVVQLVETNVDDVTGEIVAHTISRLLDNGAHDAWATPIIMKKGRPAFTVHVLCEPARAEHMAEILVAETGTLGVRATSMERWPQQRTESVVDVDGHDIRVKIASGRIKVEFDDAARAASSLGVSVREVIDRARHLAG